MKDLITKIYESLLMENESKDKFDDSMYQNVLNILKTSIHEKDNEWYDDLIHTDIKFDWNKNVTKIVNNIFNYYDNNEDNINKILTKELDDNNLKVYIFKSEDQATRGRWEGDTYGDPWSFLKINIYSKKCDYLDKKYKDNNGYNIASCRIDNGKRANHRGFVLSVTYNQKDNKQTIGKDNLSKILKILEFILDKAK